MKTAKIKLISSMFIFGTIGIFVKYIDLPSSVIATVRGALGALFLILFILIRRQKMSVNAVKKNLLVLCISGACIGVNWILLFESYKYTTVATATLCYYMAPVFVVLLSPLLLKEKLTLKKSLCVCLAIIGMVLVSGVLSGDNSANAKGIVFGLLAATAYASVMVLNKYLKEISAFDMTIMQLGTATLVILPYTLLTENVSTINLDERTAILLAVVGIVHTGITYALYFSSMQDLKAQTVAIFSYIDPAVAIILSATILREGMDVFGIIGAVLILGSTFFSELTDKREKA
ncbi:MAG: EamA/RhaT family transporter [Lachnospiraceae bacterium]|nr:EamA/RhaT family transporter [Lachnospiraceae bacterium]